jgi:hypothetical protein
MKSGCLIRACHCLETQRKRKRVFAGNWDSISGIRSPGKYDMTAGLGFFWTVNACEIPLNVCLSCSVIGYGPNL